MQIREWLWRFLAAAMLVTIAWMGWVIYLLNPPALVTSAAFEALAKSRSNSNQNSGVITPAAPAHSPAAVPGATAGAEKPAATPTPGVQAAAPGAEAAKPAAEQAAAPAKPNPAEVLEALEGWARAWSAKDADAYLGFYAKDFKVPGGETREAWEKSRRARIAAPKSITVTVDAPQVEILADDRVSVSFRQQYKSDIVVSSAVKKVLVLVRADGRWLIQQEGSGT